MFVGSLHPGAAADATGEAQPGWIHRLDELHLLTPLRILLILLVATILTLVLQRFVKRLLKQRFFVPSSDPVRASARARALANVLRSALVGLIWAAAIITVISEMGINIGAFVATATIVGGALAFGAQTLVRDLIAGFFVLAEDQYGVGDQVDLGLASGTVDRISLRSARLRDPDGTIWYVPHGAVARVGNLSQTTSVRLDLQVDRASNMDDLFRVATSLGERLAGQVGDVLTAPPTVVGLVDLSDDRLVYRLTAAIRPGKQDAVRRVWRVLVLDAFTRGDLEAPHGNETVLRVDAPETTLPMRSVTEPE
ncbi:MAG: mechanosensitive ion channel [Ilumatobacteraceae bacterium]